MSQTVAAKSEKKFKIVYGKTAAGAIVAFLLDDDGKLVVS